MDLTPHENHLLLLLWLRAVPKSCELETEAGSVHLEPGQVLYSSRTYATLTGTSPATAYRTLRTLEEKKRVVVHVKHPHAIVDVLNYSDFNRSSKAAETPTKPTVRTTWMTPFGDAWLERYGGEMHYASAAREMRRLCAQHGEATVLEAFKRYIETTPAEYASPQRFCSTFGRWAGTESRGSSPGGFLDALEEPVARAEVVEDGEA